MVRSRIVLAGEALGVPEGEIRALTAKSGRSLNSCPDILVFCDRYGVSIDWLIVGDVKPLLIGASRHRLACDDAQRAA